jgi:hypothetical protein
MKPFIDDNTRKVLMVVIPLQVRRLGAGADGAWQRLLKAC